MLAFSHELSMVERGDLAIGFGQSWKHSSLPSRIVSVGTLPVLPRHGPIMRRRRAWRIVEIAEKTYGIRGSGAPLVISVNSAAYGGAMALKRAPGALRRQPPQREH